MITVKELFGVNASGDMVGRACVGCNEALGIEGKSAGQIGPAWKIRQVQLLELDES